MHGKLDSYAIVGPAQHCEARHRALAALGVERVVVIGSSAGSDRAESMLVEEVLPALRE